MPHRFFILPEWITPPTVKLSGPIARQIKTVLRMQPGDELVVLDNLGMEYRVNITHIGKTSLEAHIINQTPAQGDPRLHLTLYQGTLKGQKFEWVLQKGTELGVSRFVPTLCQRSVINNVDKLTKKYPRWRTIIREAAEQSGRGKLPALALPLTLAHAIQQVQADSLLLMPWEEAGDPPLKSLLAGSQAETVSVFIGPEGGFTAPEAALVGDAGGHVIKLGPRILRAETAGLAVCAAIFYQMDEWA